MLITAVAFWQVILAVHIAAVVIAFGVVFTYPLFAVVPTRLDRHAVPSFHRLQQRLGRKMVNPGLTLVLLAGIYLATDLHQWHSFYTQWGVGVVIVIGGLEGSLVIPREGRLAELAERDLADGGGGDASFSAEYQSMARQVRIAGVAISLLVLVTVYLMSVQA